MSAHRISVKKIINVVSVIGLLATVLYMVYLWKQGILTDQGKMDNYISGLGPTGVIVFIIIQIIQVIIPIIPGGISCVVGISLFGVIRGLIYNYIGICIGSVAVFFIARTWGRPVMEKLFDKKKIEKYEKWLQKGNKLTIIFALLILSPVAPDDFLCYLAGTTNMKVKHYIAIILLGKPLPIAIYSLGLNAVLQMAINYIG